MKILIVDDDGHVRTAFTRLLTSHGYEVSCAFTATAAIAELGNNAPDVVLLDIDLGAGPTGWAVAGYMQTVPHLHKTQIIVISGLSPKDIRDGAKSYANTLANAALILGKPINFGELIRAIENIEKRNE